MNNTIESAANNRMSHWAGIIQKRSASGMSIKAYCETNGITKNVYFYWQRKLREAACQELLPGAIANDEKPAVPGGWAVCSAEPLPALHNCSGAAVTIEIGKSRVTAESGVDLEFLKSVCLMLVSLC